LNGAGNLRDHQGLELGNTARGSQSIGSGSNTAGKGFRAMIHIVVETMFKFIQRTAINSMLP
jgi:hypothetical protein